MTLNEIMEIIIITLMVLVGVLFVVMALASQVNTV